MARGRVFGWPRPLALVSGLLKQRNVKRRDHLRHSVADRGTATTGEKQTDRQHLSVPLLDYRTGIAASGDVDRHTPGPNGPLGQVGHPAGLAHDHARGLFRTFAPKTTPDSYFTNAFPSERSNLTCNLADHGEAVDICRQLR